jgi:hypothetical protein
MGVVSPVLDFQVATRFRAERMRWRPNMNATRKILEAFGYTEKDLEWVDQSGMAGVFS